MVVSGREVKEAFDFMSAGQEELTQAAVMDFMEANFRPLGLGSLIPREPSTLVGKEPMTQERLTRLLVNNQLGAEADPVGAVFKCLANKSSGFITVETLKRLLQTVPGIGELNRDDVEFLMNEVDADGDGRISLEDFAQIGGFSALAIEEAQQGQGAGRPGGDTEGLPTSPTRGSGVLDGKGTAGATHPDIA